MMRLRLIAVLFAVLGVMACEKDPARSVKIVERPVVQQPPPPPPTPPADPPAATAAATPSGTPAPIPAAPAAPAAAPRAAEFHLAACPPPPEDGSGPGNVTVEGPCAFQHQAAVSCEAVIDDFLVVTTRKARNGATVMVFINVERYTGPGTYSKAQMFLGVQDKLNIWKWSSDDVNITVGAGEAFADLPATRLEAEPVLVNCTGPINNYQCEGRGDEPAFEASIETVSGRFQCGATPSSGR